MGSKRFVTYFLSIVGGSLILVFIFNFIVDPFGVERTFLKKGFNRYKEAFHMNTRVTKLPLSEGIDPEILFFGSSRTEYLAPEQVLSSEKRARSFNFALSGGMPHEMRDMLEWAIDRYPVEEVYYGIDFISLTDRTPEYRKGFDHELVDGKQPLWAGEARFFLTFTALRKSRACIEQNRKDPDGSGVKYQYNRHGSRTNRWRRMMLEERGKEWFVERFARTHEQFKKQYADEGLSLSSEKMQAYKDIRRICQREGITFRAFVPPIHFSQFRTLLGSRSFDLYKEFLRFLGRNGGFYYFERNEGLMKDSSLFWDTQHARRSMSRNIIPKVKNPGGSGKDRFRGEEVESLLQWLEARKKLTSEMKNESFGRGRDASFEDPGSVCVK